MGRALTPGDLTPILRSVEKPGRYVGGEFGAQVKAQAALRVAISYPDLYEIGMSNAAVKILYSLLNALPDVSCERVFAPAPDFEAALRGAGVPLCSLETGLPLSDFDLIGFSFGYELTLTNILAILEMGGVTVEAAGRGGNEPIVLAGGPAATNPVPLGLFVDAVFIGEAEGWLGGAFSDLAAMKRRGAGRQDLLSFLRSQPSIWYAGKETPVRRALWRGFAVSQADTVFPVPSMRVVQDHGTVEIMRGCPNACKFCHATIYYRACRQKETEIIREEVEALVEKAGYRQLTLTSLSSGDFQHLHEMVRELNQRYSSRKISFSLPSLRVDSLSLGLLKEISEVRKSGLTFAVETANPEWQREVRKTVTLEKTIAIMREAKAQGWKGAKFYFMVGLPPGIEQDESSPIIEFLRAVRAATNMSLNVNVASFIPKPHTPWQRARQIGEEEAAARIFAVKKGLAGDGFKIGYHAPILSLLEGIVARGDEKAGRLVLDAYRRGARLDAWEEHIKINIWRAAIANAGWDVLGETCRQRDPGEKLPWEGIALGLSSSEISDAPQRMPPAGAERPAPEVAAETPVGTGTRVLFSFSKAGAASFISHLDLMTVFERAFARAGFAVRFTEGFNPKPRLEFANPLSLGLDSREEIAGIDLFDYDTEELFIRQMNGALPPGLRVLRAGMIPHDGVSRRKSLMSLYWGGDFEVTGETGETRILRLPATGPSIRKTLEAEGVWKTVHAQRLATWAAGPRGGPLGYFEALSPSLT
ncbi:MAG: TIGR03936 family radical SAM-associated protein [Spirochaetia bacterium]